MRYRVGNLETFLLRAVLLYPQGRRSSERTVMNLFVSGLHDPSHRLPFALACAPEMTVVGCLSKALAPNSTKQAAEGRTVFVRVLLCVLASMVGLADGPVRAEDLDAGKSGPRLFATSCASCHRNPRSLAKQTNSWSLNLFLRKHYTASSQQANALTAYLLSADNAAPREKRKAAAAGPQPSILSWFGWPSDSGRKPRKPAKRAKAVSHQPAAAAPAVPDPPKP